MEENSSFPLVETQRSANDKIPFDRFVSKKYEWFGCGGFLRFTDSEGVLVYAVQKLSGADDHHRIKLLLDSSDNTLFSISRVSEGSWQGFRVNGDEKDLIFIVKKTVDKYTRTEFKIVLVGEHNDVSSNELRMVGSPFMRACTIYKDNFIVAQENIVFLDDIWKPLIKKFLVNNKYEKISDY
ncbi:hypothetical protein OROMI_033152 [Orobanche minor]